MKYILISLSSRSIPDFSLVNNRNPIVSFLESTTEALIFSSRWIQAPMYVGLIFGSILYLSKFIEELILIAENIETATGLDAMLTVLAMIDASMVLNLAIMMIVGGYTVFTSRLDFSETEDKPQWLDKMDAGRLKIHLASSLALISGVQLLKTFIDVQKNPALLDDLKFVIAIHLVFILSALLLAWVERVLAETMRVTAEMMGAGHHKTTSPGFSIEEGGPGI